MKKLTKNKRVHKIFTLLIIFIIICGVIGVVFMVMKREISPWNKLNGNIISQSDNNKGTDVIISDFYTKNNSRIDKVKGIINYSGFFGKEINLNGVYNSGITLPYSSSLYIKKSNSVIEYSLKYQKKSLILDFNIPNINVNNFSYNLYIHYTKKAINLTPSGAKKPKSNSTKLIPLRHANKIIKTINLPMDNTNTLVRRASFYTGVQLASYPEHIINDSYTLYIPGAASTRYAPYNDLDSGINSPWNIKGDWWGGKTTSDHIYDLPIKTELSPLVLNYNANNNTNTENRIKQWSFATDTNVYFYSETNSRNFAGTVDKTSLNFQTLIEDYFSKNYNFKKNTSSTLTIYGLKLTTGIGYGWGDNACAGRAIFNEVTYITSMTFLLQQA